MKLRYVRVLAGTILFCSAQWAQIAVVSLTQARQTALQNHPKIASAALDAQASAFVVRETRSAYYPTLSGNLTGVGTERGSVVSAGAVTTSSIYSRGSTDLVGNQLVTDFGRTGSLVESAKLRRAARSANVTYTRAQVLLEVQDAYYQALAALAVQKVARATLDLRRLTLRQVSALADSALRSKVDVSFAQVTVSQAQLDVIRAENDARASHARLSAAMGYGRDQSFTLADEELPGPLSQDVDGMIAQALRDRPDLATLRLNWDSLKSYADAERKLHNPSVVVGVVTGVAPVRDERLPETYNAAGFNMNIPVFNGGLFKARHEEAESHAAAADKDVQALAVAVARDVQVAWLDANDAFQRLDVTARMVDEASEALRLAQSRYDNALGSIIELNQAQLDQTAAEIAAASAKYEYLARRANLSYAMGELR
jgi:outer membrane protein